MSPPAPDLDGLRIRRNENEKPRSRLIPAVFAIIAIIIAATGFAWYARARPIDVRTAAAQEIAGAGADHTVLNASGYVTARREATVSSKVTGRVDDVLVEEGMKVTEGQVVARLDATNVKAAMELAQAQARAAHAALDETRVRLVEAQQELQRQTQLLKRSVAAQADFDHADAAAKAQSAHLEQLRAEAAVADRTVGVYQQQLDDTVIRAPFAGTVTSKNAQPGEMISPMSTGGFTRTGICTVVDMESLEIEIDVNESYINRVSPNQPVEATLDAYPDWKIPCHVIAIIPTADRSKSTVRVRVGFDKLDPRILPEMSVKVGFRETSSSAAALQRTVSIPRSALVQQGDRTVVMIVKDGHVDRRAITIGSADNDTVTITAGVAAGEHVIVNPPTDLNPGSRVKETTP